MSKESDYLCNLVRDLLSELTRIRWCGSELESMFHPNIWRNASEICGLANLGMHINWEGKTVGSFPDPSTNDVTTRFLKFVGEIPDLGTRKLFSISPPIFIPGCDVIYVGSSPDVKITSFTDILPDLEDSKKYAFVWDVRADMPCEHEERERILAGEP
ncbi:unnamed protein product [Parnassius apollo]|uniref:(apollo) hypothetical protein n=1 Tax=Parnassius apollo TaxID=110799 RepID=A0A8S3VYD7_PARAO|nr:unnamed protein product [Parnassius apollo]